MDNLFARKYVLLLDFVCAGNRICTDGRKLIESSLRSGKACNYKRHADRNDDREEYDRTIALIRELAQIFGDSIYCSAVFTCSEFGKILSEKAVAVVI